MDEDKPKKLLVVYGSQTGCARSYAEAVGVTLQEEGFDVTIDDSNHNPSPEGYQGIVIFGGIRAARWDSAIVGWMQAHASVLQKVPIAAAIVCLSILNPNKISSSLSWIDGVLADTGVAPISRAAFPGWYLSSMLSLPDRMMMKVMGTPEGDFRNLSASQDWARQLAEQFNR